MLCLLLTKTPSERFALRTGDNANARKDIPSLKKTVVLVCSFSPDYAPDVPVAKV